MYDLIIGNPPYNKREKNESRVKGVNFDMLIWEKAREVCPDSRLVLLMKESYAKNPKKFTSIQKLGKFPGDVNVNVAAYGYEPGKETLQKESIEKSKVELKNLAIEKNQVKNSLINRVHKDKSSIGEKYRPGNVIRGQVPKGFLGVPRRSSRLSVFLPGEIPVRYKDNEETNYQLVRAEIGKEKELKNYILKHASIIESYFNGSDIVQGFKVIKDYVF